MVKKSHRGDVHDVGNLNNKAPKEIHIVFHNDSAYDYSYEQKNV